MTRPVIHFSALLPKAELLERGVADPLIADIAYDSRRVVLGAAFVAMQGGTTDGNRYVQTALENGAAAIVTDSDATWRELRQAQPDLAVAKVRHGRRALAEIAAAFFGHPEKKLTLSGVTGTNGKTTTTYLLESMLRSAGRTSIMVGTIEYHVGGEVRPSPHTTPESRDLFELFAEGVQADATEAVMEVSSHALDQGRVWGLHWDTAVFTNLTQDHLDYHGDMESYFQAKAKMFLGTGAAPPRVAAIHAGDSYGERLIPLARNAGCEIVTYAMERGDFYATDVQLAAQGTRFRMVTPAGMINVRTQLAGPVNVLNLLAASAAAMARGLTLKEIVRGVESIQHVPGRFQTVDCGQPFTVAIDYAHTEDALRNVTRLARELASAHNGRVITVFGCGGDRDRSKRPRMGRAAGDGSDFVVATSDNPRSENPATILAEILPGLVASGTRFIVEEDRMHAIHLALAEARANDVIVIAGKGHEKVQIVGDSTLPFDDAEVARQMLLENQSVLDQ
ncbi:MAG: UDP-N-acetylmuramoyl-L-alanyl-D-glutamate--2,6-diaminopimelate ligase [Acidobacteriaceae bacterium]